MSFESSTTLSLLADWDAPFRFEFLFETTTNAIVRGAKKLMETRTNIAPSKNIETVYHNVADVVRCLVLILKKWIRRGRLGLKRECWKQSASSASIASVYISS